MESRLQLRFAVSAVLIALAMTAPALTAPRASADDSGSGAPVSWYGYDGSSITSDAAAEALLATGDPTDAEDVAQQVADNSTQAPEATQDSINEVLDDATSATQQTAVTALLSIPGQSPSDTVADDSDASAAAAATPDADPPGVYGHGESKAESLYNWVLHGTMPTKIYYGECQNYVDCTTGGYINVTDTSNTYFAPDAYFSTKIREGSGLHATFSNHKVRIYQDRNNAVDSVKGTLSCSSSGYSALDCSGNVVGPNVTGDYYYYRQDFSLSATGIYVSDVQIQTRRWKVVANNNWQFLSYNYGG